MQRERSATELIPQHGKVIVETMRPPITATPIGERKLGSRG